MPISMQSKLLRAMDNGSSRAVGGSVEDKVDFRLVAATHRDLPERIAEGRFREDFMHRIAVVEVCVPSLRDRTGDLPLIVESLTPRLVAETGFPAIRIAPCAWETLARLPWPGNVRQLHAVLARAILRANGAMIEVSHLDPPTPPIPSDSQLERRMIEQALVASNGVIQSAAQRIGWTRQKLTRRIQVLDIHPSFEVRFEVCR